MIAGTPKEQSSKFLARIDANFSMGDLISGEKSADIQGLLADIEFQLEITGRTDLDLLSAKGVALLYTDRREDGLNILFDVFNESKQAYHLKNLVRGCAVANPRRLLEIKTKVHVHPETQISWLLTLAFQKDEFNFMEKIHILQFFSDIPKSMKSVWPNMVASVFSTNPALGGNFLNATTPLLEELCDYEPQDDLGRLNKVEAFIKLAGLGVYFTDGFKLEEVKMPVLLRQLKIDYPGIFKGPSLEEKISKLNIKALTLPEGTVLGTPAEFDKMMMEMALNVG